MRLASVEVNQSITPLLFFRYVSGRTRDLALCRAACVVAYADLNASSHTSAGESVEFDILNQLNTTIKPREDAIRSQLEKSFNFFSKFAPSKKFEDLQKNSKICTEIQRFDTNIQRFAQKFDRLHKNSTVCGALFFCNSFSRIVTHFLDPYFFAEFREICAISGGFQLITSAFWRHCTYSPLRFPPSISLRFPPSISEISSKYILRFPPSISLRFPASISLRFHCKYILVPEISSKYIPEISSKYIPEISSKYILRFPPSISLRFPASMIPEISCKYILRFPVGISLRFPQVYPEISCKYILEIFLQVYPSNFSTIFPVNSPTICTILPCKFLHNMHTILL